MYAMYMVKSIVEIDNQIQKYILYYIQKNTSNEIFGNRLRPICDTYT
jgi:hypothetical protein